MPPPKPGSVLALPLNESPLTQSHVCSLSSLGPMSLLPLAFSHGTSCPLTALLCTDSKSSMYTQEILSVIASVFQNGLTGTEAYNCHLFTWDSSLVLMWPTSCYFLGSQILLTLSGPNPPHLCRHSGGLLLCFHDYTTTCPVSHSLTNYRFSWPSPVLTLRQQQLGPKGEVRRECGS